MRRSLHLGSFVASFALAACATGATLDDGFGGYGGTGASTVAHGAGTTKSSTAALSESQSATTGSLSGNTTGSGPSSTAAGPGSGPSTTSAVGPSTVATTGSGTTMCDPENPGPGCGPAEQCVPEPSGPPVCDAAGAGGPYDLCSTRGDCAPASECVSDGTDACCMIWCQVGANDCANPSETCTSLGTPLYVNGVEYGVCWDGYPCVL